MMAIITLMNQIKNEEIILPAIQRDFVWETEQIESLMDSIMRGYPIGIVLLWETYSDIKYRLFDKDFKSGNVTDSSPLRSPVGIRASHKI